MRHFFFLFAVLNATAGSLLAQTVLVSEPYSIRNDFGYELIGRLRDRILVFRDRNDHFSVQAYDEQMRLSWMRDLDDLDKKGIQVLSVTCGRDDFSVVYKLKRKGRYYLRVHKYDPGAQLIDTLTVKQFGERLYTPPALDILRSEDHNCIAIYNSGERGLIEAVCVRLDKMKILWDQAVSIPVDQPDSGLRAMTLADNGDLYVVSEWYNRRNRLDEHELRLTQVSGQNQYHYRIPLREYLTHDLDVIPDGYNGQAVIAGFYSDKGRERAHGVFMIRADVRAEQTLLSAYAPFDLRLLSAIRKRDYEDETSKGVDDAKVTRLLLREDGGLVVVAERSHEILRGAMSGRGMFREGMRAIIDFYYDDIIAIALHADGTAHWSAVLHKKQYSQDDEGVFSSFFLMRAPERISFLFNDEIKYESTSSAYGLYANGYYERSSLINTVNANLRLRYRDALQIGPRECLIPSELRNKMRLVLLKM